MAENEPNPTAMAPKERSPSFPFIPLGVAVKRLEDFDKKFGRHPAPATKAGLAWDMKEKSSQAFQTLAALKAYEFVSYEGSGDKRTASLTDSARTYLRAQQDHIKTEVLKKAAVKPKQISKFWAIWSDDPPPDEIRLDQLILDNGYTDSAAKTFLKVYDDTIAFSGLSGSDKTNKISDEGGDEEAEPRVKVGDWVQWISQGALQFQTPRRVIDVIQDDKHGWYVSVEGYNGALPIGQIEIAEEPKFSPNRLQLAKALPFQATQNELNEPIEVLLSAGRIQINANVGLTGLKKLKAMLDKYEEILQIDNVAKEN
jgi:hypothetical protein